MMALVHRALFTWFLYLLFLILLVLRLDQRMTWNWFLIFLPLWLFDSIVIVYIIFYMITHCKYRFDRHDMSMLRKMYYLGVAFLKMAFQVMICLKLEYLQFMSLYYIMIPCWFLLLVVTCDISFTLLAV